ncbi:MAG: pseudouridine synthase [Bacteroidia bacterium]|nr:pseudouridine synthase [Bacteroidia bacterium]MCZ2247853.1 pseudouridine synthase [Bacteroidia bacterium]
MAKTINSFLVQTLKISHKQASQIITDKKVTIDELTALHHQPITELNTIYYLQQCLQKGKELYYYAYYKPVGVESTLNQSVKNNLIEATGISHHFFPIGRLDKASEGLMILTNDGNLYQQVINHNSTIEKVYRVQTNKQINDNFLHQLSIGVVILGKKTKPCKVKHINLHTFEITLTEGKNRQIRRMCYKLGYEVTSLKRISIGKLLLNENAYTVPTLINKRDII